VAKKNKTIQEKRISANTSMSRTVRPVLSSHWLTAQMGANSSPNKSRRDVFINNSVGNCSKHLAHFFGWRDHLEVQGTSRIKIFAQNVL
jgi:hypothetical protein